MFAEVITKILRRCFLTHGVYIMHPKHCRPINLDKSQLGLTEHQYVGDAGKPRQWHASLDIGYTRRDDDVLRFSLEMSRRSWADGTTQHLRMTHELCVIRFHLVLLRSRSHRSRCERRLKASERRRRHAAVGPGPNASEPSKAERQTTAI